MSWVLFARENSNLNNNQLKKTPYRPSREVTSSLWNVLVRISRCHEHPAPEVKSMPTLFFASKSFISEQNFYPTFSRVNIFFVKVHFLFFSVSTSITLSLHFSPHGEFLFFVLVSPPAHVSTSLVYFGTTPLFDAP